MKTTVESLKHLYVKLGGTLDDVSGISAIPDMIDVITTKAGSSGGELVVTDDGNGNVTIKSA